MSETAITYNFNETITRFIVNSVYATNEDEVTHKSVDLWDECGSYESGPRMGIEPLTYLEKAKRTKRPTEVEAEDHVGASVIDTPYVLQSLSAHREKPFDTTLSFTGQLLNGANQSNAPNLAEYVAGR